jgi:hypothetical protein
MNTRIFHAAGVLAALVLVVTVVLMVSGCSTSSTGPLPASTPVKMSAMFSKSGTPGVLLKVAAVPGYDSLRIDSAIVVISRIKFLRHADSVAVDTGDARNDSLEHDSSIVFRGPFVVHIHDTVSIDFANQVLPTGTYDGIKFKIHRLENGEAHEDADEHHHHMVQNDSSAYGASIVVWGAVHKDSVWQSFTFLLNDELEFKVKGNFVVPASTSTVNIALNVNMASWFASPVDGSLLDPTDSTWSNRRLIRQAIAKSFGSCRGGHDMGDGHPD